MCQKEGESCVLKMKERIAERIAQTVQVTQAKMREHEYTTLHYTHTPIRYDALSLMYRHYHSALQFPLRVHEH